MPLLSTFALPVFLLVVFTLVAFSIGRRILAMFKAELDQLEEFLVSTALGAGFLIYLGIFLGTFHLLYKEAYILLAAVVIGLSIRQTRHFWQLIAAGGRHVKQRLKPSLAGLLLLAYIFFILINWLPAFAPIADSDALTYHLAFAKVYANNHQLVYQPSQVYTTMPQGMTMLYTISELFSTPNLSSLIAYSFGIFASLAIYAIVRKYYSEFAALIASLLFFTSPAVIEKLRQTVVDISLTFFFLLGVMILFRYADERDERKRTALVILLSILIGTAASVKLTGMISAAALFAGMALSWLLYKQKFNANSVKQVLIFGFIALLFISPWLAWGYAYTGNPIYPQAYNLFGGKYLDSSLTQFYSDYHKSVGLERNLLNAMLVHWNITFNSRAFDAVVGLTPFFLMALPLVLFIYRDIRDMRKWAIIFAMSAFILVVEFWVHPVIRYMFPGIALLSISTAITMEALMKHNKLLKVTIFLLLMASLVFNAAMWYGINAKNIRYFAAGESKGEYYAKLKNYNLDGAISWINANTTPDSVVMMFNDPRGYFLDRKYIVSSPYQTYIDYNGMNSTTALLNRLNELGVSYILINDKLPRFNNYEYSINGDKYVNKLLGSFINERGQLVYDENHVRVYKILPAAAG